MKNNTKKSIEKFICTLKDKLIKILKSNLSARQIAFNFTIGILIGIIVPIGLQTIAVILLVTIFKLNFMIIIFATLISNPLTIAFIYYSAFKIGEIFINSGISWVKISEVFNNPDLESILGLSLESLKVIYTGLLIESVVLCLLTYIIIYYLAKNKDTLKYLFTSKVE